MTVRFLTLRVCERLHIDPRTWGRSTPEEETELLVYEMLRQQEECRMSDGGCRM